MEDRELEIVELDGKEYAVLEEIDNVVYTVNVENPKDIKFLENILIDGEEYLNEVDDFKRDELLAKFASKYKDLLVEKEEN